MCRAGDFLVRLRKPPVRSPAFRRRSVETRPNPVAIFTESLLPPQFPSPNKTGPAFHRNPRSPGFRHVPRNCPIQSACHFQQGKPAALAPETFQCLAACLNPGPKPTHRFPVEKRGNLSQSCRSLHRNPWQSLLPPRISRPRRNRERLFTASPQPRIPPRPNPLAIFG